jgi:hypothetical protein
MNQISNAEKQVRFRKKEQLKRCADNIFREWQRQPWNRKISEDVLQYSLDKAIDLPSGWTDEDYERALRALEQLHADLLYTSDQLKNDVDAGWDSLMTVSDGVKYISDNKAAVENARALAAHLISALRLSKCNDADQAAALMEALRFVGRSLASKGDIPRPQTSIYPRSQAITICLAMINPHYSRPDWFAEELANTLQKQIDKNLAHEVGRRMSNFNHKDDHL